MYDFKGAIESDWTWQAFGRELILSEDLDPVYNMLADAQHVMGDDMLKRWLLAYTCYYSAGVASNIAERPSDEFYDGMWEGIEKDWPRGMERRYFWGDQAVNAIKGLEALGPAEGIMDFLIGPEPRVFNDVNERVKSLTGYGPWMGWKVADMIDRVLAEYIDFSESTLGIYKDPVQGAAMVMFGDWRHPITEGELQQIVDEQVAEFEDLLAPPYYDRPVNIQEVETNLCKFKAHYKAHYPMGNDTYHVREGLVGWGDLAQELLWWCPEIKPGHKGYVQ